MPVGAHPEPTHFPWWCARKTDPPAAHIPSLSAQGISGLITMVMLVKIRQMYFRDGLPCQSVSANAAG